MGFVCRSLKHPSKRFPGGKRGDKNLPAEIKKKATRRRVALCLFI